MKALAKILTISIAAYNVEKYIDRTLSSLNDPRFLDDIEVLIIDDGSSDNTKQIAMEYEASAPDTFHYISKENGGHGSTINCGIRHATGKYFRVVDGDDWVDTNSFALYVDRLKHTEADMILTPMKTNCNGKEITDNYTDGMDEGEVYTWDDQINIRMVTIHTMTLCTDLLKRNDVRITEKSFYVDIEYVAWGIYLAETIASFRMPTYVYRMGNMEQSVSMKSRLKNIDMQESVSYQLARLYEQFKRPEKLKDKQNLLLFDRISISIYWTIRTYMMLPDRDESKLRITTFENNIRRLSPSLFQMMGTKKLFKLLRFSHYKCISALRWVYRSNLFSK